MKTLLGMDFSDEAHVKSTLLTMLVFLITYTVSYKLLRKKFPDKSAEYCCRIVTFIHGVFAVYAAVRYVVLPSLGYYKVVSMPSSFILAHSMGYFTFDLIWCFIPSNGETPVMKFHHILTVTGLFYYSFKLSKQFFIVYALGLTEVTNPLLQMRWFLKDHGKRDSLAFKIIEPIFITMFFIIRVFVLSFYLYEAWFNKELEFNADDLTFTTLGALTGYALSYQMFNYICYQMKKSKGKKNKETTKEQ